MEQPKTHYKAGFTGATLQPTLEAAVGDAKQFLARGRAACKVPLPAVTVYQSVAVVDFAEPVIPPFVVRPTA